LHGCVDKGYGKEKNLWFRAQTAPSEQREITAPVKLERKKLMHDEGLLIVN